MQYTHLGVQGHHPCSRAQEGDVRGLHLLHLIRLRDRIVRIIRGMLRGDWIMSVIRGLRLRSIYLGLMGCMRQEGCTSAPSACVCPYTWGAEAGQG
jgi:hypothetical protein